MTVSRGLSFLAWATLSSLFFAGCGSSGGGSSAPSGSKIFEKDMEALSTSQVMLAKSVDNQMNGAFTKAFGGTTNSDVSQFIDERVKYVYNESEVRPFRVSIYDRFGKLEASTTMREILGNDSTSNGPLNTAGMNIGAAMAMYAHESNSKIEIHLPVGIKEADSLRIGLVVITKYYSIIKDQKGKQYQIPLEGRASVLVHEGRHSDCPNGYQSDDCGFLHRECPTGPAAGIPACDNSFWGPYAMGALYLKSTLDNYSFGSDQQAIVQSLSDDSFSRLDSKQMSALYSTDPELGSR